MEKKENQMMNGTSTNKTLVTALEEIWRKANDCELTDEYFEEIKDATDYVNEVLHVDPVQSFILSVLIDNANPMAPKQIGYYAKCSNIKMLTYEDKFDDLRRRKMIRRASLYIRGEKLQGYTLNPDFLHAVKENRTFDEGNSSKMIAEEVIEEIGNCLKLADDDFEMYDVAYNDICELLNETNYLEFCKKIIDLKLADNELMMYLIAAYMQICRGYSDIELPQYRDILRGSKHHMSFIKSLNNGENQLVTRHLLENATEDGMAMPNCFTLTEYSLKNIFGEFDCRLSKNVDVSDLLQPEKVESKKMFYNEREAGQVNRLEELLNSESFAGIQNRLKAAKMRPGFACLFYGSPGTGKTETVLQLCKKTGRPVLQVNVADLKSKWVGDSEKQVQALFDRYEVMTQKCELCPILLFNEADAIISKRTKNVTHAVDKMENAIQNIILQGMEKLNGIMIATTNLTENMDDAFERRFLYKIRFDKPGLEVKTRIWRSMIPQLSEDDAKELAKSYDFSGGQIENIARKQTVDAILYNTQINLEAVRNLCDEESIKTDISRKPVGFGC